MVESIDKERVMGIIKHEKSVVDFFTGAETGIIVSCFSGKCRSAQLQESNL